MATKQPNQPIETILNQVGVPTIDTSFFSSNSTQQLEQNYTQRKASHLLHSLEKLGNLQPLRQSNQTRTPHLNWQNTNSEAKNTVLTYFASNQTGYTNVELESLKKLPLFQTINNEFTTLTNNTTTSSTNGETKNNSGTEFYYLKRTDATIPDMLSSSNTSRLLKRKQGPLAEKLYNSLGVTELQEIDLFQKFVIPEFDGLNRNDKSKFTEQLCTNWKTLKANASLITTLKNLEFIPIDLNRYAKPSDLLDPRNQTLSTLFQSSPDLFPKGEYASKKWLKILSELGLKNKLDQDLYPKACTQLSHDFTTAKRNCDDAKMYEIHER
jgi:hypothetical protein